MLRNFWRRRKYLKSVNALDLIPVPLVKYELTDNGRVKLRVPRFKNNFFRILLTRNHISPEFKISLDEIGSHVWLLIDAQKTASEITHELLKIYEDSGIKLDSADERVVAFISKLYRENLIDFRGIKL